jgi:integrase
LPQEILEVLEKYLRLERPLTNSPALFVCLKGRRRGRPVSSAGLRSLFRHHRLRSQITHAHPHRLRHTFGALQGLLRDILQKDANAKGELRILHLMLYKCFLDAFSGKPYFELHHY